MRHEVRGGHLSAREGGGVGREQADRDEEASDELDDTGEAHHRPQGDLVPAQHAEELLGAVAGEQQGDHDSHHRVDLGGESSEDTFH